MVIVGAFVGFLLRRKAPLLGFGFILPSGDRAQSGKCGSSSAGGRPALCGLQLG